MSRGNPTKQDQKEEEESIVYLGYIEDGDEITQELGERPTCDADKPSCSKESDQDELPPWLVNKIGGFPIFPFDQSKVQELESTLELLKCKHCKGVCVLIFQINSPIDESPLARVLQVYTCIKSDCIKHSWFALRCMFNVKSSPVSHTPTEISSTQLEVVNHPTFGCVLVARQREFFKPYYVSVIEEPTGREDFAKNNLEALKLASKFSDPDLKPAPIEEKYKNLKNYKPPQQPANLSDLDDFEKFQMEKLYGNDKDMYRFYKRVGRFQSQVVRYDWEGKPLLNSNKIKLNIQQCTSCSGKRKFEFQLMSAVINYLKTDREFDREAQDFSSVLVHSCSKNCSQVTYNIEDTYFVPDPDSRIFNKVKQRIIALKIAGKGVPDDEQAADTADSNSGGVDTGAIPTQSKPSMQQPSAKKKKNKRRNKK